jgi:hypothetical protein
MTLEIHAIGVSAGDATLIISRSLTNPAAILIDSGIDTDTVASYLQDLGVYKLDLIVATHPDYDHLEGLLQVVNSPVLSASELWCFDLSILRDFLRDGTISLSKKEDHRIIYSLVTADDLLRRATIKGIRAYQVSSGHARTFGNLYVKVLYPPQQFYSYIMNPDILRRLLGRKEAPLDWFPMDFEYSERTEDRKITRKERRLAVERILTEREPMVDISRDKVRELYQESESLGPEFRFTGESLFNEMSIVLRITVCYEDRTFSLLFPGDLSDWTYLIATNISELCADFWKIPHHGSIRVRWDPQKAFDYAENLVVSKTRPGGSLTELPLFPACLCPRVFTPKMHAGSLDEISAMVSPSYFLVYPYPARRLPDANLDKIVSRPSILFADREDRNPPRLNNANNHPRHLVLRRGDFATELVEDPATEPPKIEENSEEEMRFPDVWDP